MQIIHLTTWKETCGIANYAQNLIDGLDKLGFKNHVYPIESQQQQYLTVEEIYQHFSKFIEMARDFDAVHIQHEHSFFCGSHSLRLSVDVFRNILAKLSGRKKPVVVTFHTNPVFLLSEPGSKKEILKNFYLKLDWQFKIAPFFNTQSQRYRAIVHNKRGRLQFIKSGFHAQSLHVMNFAIAAREDFLYSKLTQEECKQKLNLPEDCRLLSMFGFVSDYKGYDVAIEALESLPENYHLAIVGGSHPKDLTGKTIDRILEMAAELEVSDRLHITGFIDFSTLNLYHRATDFCLAPYKPGFASGSSALSWALSSSRPIVATKIAAFNELNQDHACLLLAAPDSPRELAWQILQLEKDKQLQDQLVARALEYTKKYTWDWAATEYAKLYT